MKCIFFIIKTQSLSHLVKIHI